MDAVPESVVEAGPPPDAVGLPESATGPKLLRLRIPLLLSGLAAVFTVARYLVLVPLGYPPSSDAAGDLIWLHTYLGHPVPGFDLGQLPPPIYFFAIVAPFDLAMGPFAGAQWTMAVVPSLLTFPAYRLARAAGADRAPSLVVAALLGSSGALSLMVTWNSGYNAFAIVLLTAYFAELLRYLDRPTRNRMLVAGLLFAAIAGSHLLTFLFAAVTTAFVLLGHVLLGPARRAAARAAVWVAGTGALFALPFASILYANYRVSTNVGGPVSPIGLHELGQTYATFPALTWGFQGNTPPPTLTGFAYAVLIGVGLAGLVIIWGVPRFRRLAIVSTSIVAAVLLLGPLDPSNADRLGYFLPIAVMPALVGIAPFLSRVAERLVASRPRTPPSGAPTPVLARAPRRRSVGAIVAVCAAVLLVSTATTLSLQEMQESSRYYLILNGNVVAALDWIRSQTPATAKVFDGADLYAWIPGYADRFGYSPGNLQAEVTGPSYQTTFDANLIALGSSVLADGSLYVGTNLPGAANSPGIYLRTAASYAPFLVGSLGNTFVTLPNSTGAVPLSGGQPGAVSTGVTSAGVPYFTADYRFPTQSATVVQTMELNGTTVSETLGLAGSSSPLPWRTDYLIPPSGYYFNYSLTTVAGSQALARAFQFAGGTFGVAFGANVSVLASPLPNGWAIVDLAPFGQSVSAQLVGWSFGVAAPSQAFSTAALAASLGIGYVVVDSAVNYAVYVRFVTEAALPIPQAAAVFASGPVSIFTPLPP